MFYVAVTPSPYSRPDFTDFDTREEAEAYATQYREKALIGFASVVWKEIEPGVWATRNPDGSTRFDTRYVEIGQD